ncbi:hypothetical protein I4U23_030651 [Adineta vaga]|nr:hypothetical protein I4U23_030651 [Adineta vaga]
MGGGSSRRRKPNTPIPSYAPGLGGSPGISRPGNSVVTGVGNPTGINPNQQRDLMQAQQTIANLTNQLNAYQRNASGGMPIQQMPYGNYSGPSGTPPMMPYGTPPQMGYGTPPMMPYGSPSYAPPSPTLQHFAGQNPYPYPYPSPPMPRANGYRDTDFAAIANISGLNPGDVALLHREYMNLTRGGINKIDRVIFRQILRDVLLEANNEHVDRAIENMFVTIDRNRDGFIDFPEFIGAFKDVLKGNVSDAPNYFQDDVYPDILGSQLRAAGVGSGVASQSVARIQQAAPAQQFVTTGGLNIVPLASTAIQQTPLICSPAQISDASAPVLTLDPNQSSYVIATPGQYLITQPTALQCVPLPMM